MDSMQKHIDSWWMIRKNEYVNTLGNNGRGSGRTKKQMLLAPKNAIFVWQNRRLHYPKSLAYFLGRRDLKIVSQEWLGSYRSRGVDLSRIVFDHYCDALSFETEQMIKLQSKRSY